MACLRLAAVMAAALATTAAPALAGSVQVSPINVQLIGRERTSTVRLRNLGEEAVRMQIRTVDWTQPDGQDAYQPSTTLRASPPAFEIKGGEEQTVRLVIEGTAAQGKERAWRLIVDEIPTQPSSEGSGVQVPVRMLVPVFLTPSTGARPKLSWSATRSGADLTLSARNAGDTFERVSGVKVTADGAAIGPADGYSGYVLSGSSRRWVLPAPAGVSRVQAAGQGVFDPIQADVAVAPQ